MNVDISTAAKTLSELVTSFEKEPSPQEIVITRDGRPVAKLVPVNPAPTTKRIGVARGAFEVPDSIDTHNNDVATVFQGASKL